MAACLLAVAARSMQGASRPAASYTGIALCCPAGGVFKLELFLPEDYPMAAPKVMWRRPV